MTIRTQALSMALTCPVPGSDPVPHVTARFRAAGAFERTRKGEPTAEALAAALDVLQSMVSAMQDDEREYRVSYEPGLLTAGTDFKGRNVVIGTKPLMADDLTDGQRAAILTAMANHEVAHIVHTRKWMPTMEPHFRTTRPGDDRWQRIHNVADDVRMEALHWSEWPGYADTFPTAMWYAGKRGKRVGDHAPLDTMDDRMQSMMVAIRYPWLFGWDEAHERAFADWCREWQTRYNAATTAREAITLIDEALDFLGAYEPPPPGKGKGKGGTGKGDETDEPQPGKGKGDEGDDESEGGGAKGDEPEDGDDAESEGEGDDESDEGESDEPGRSEGEGKPESTGADEPEPEVLRDGELAGTDRDDDVTYADEGDRDIPDPCPIDATLDAFGQTNAQAMVDAHAKSISKTADSRVYPMGNGTTITVQRITLRKGTRR